MSVFECKVHVIGVEPHPNADRLDLAVVDGYRCVVAKGQFADGDLAAYIPEGAVCPEWLIGKLGLEGRLAGKSRNRVKAVKLRGALSQGLVYPVENGRIRDMVVAEGDDVTDLLELAKYEPPVPVSMNGIVEAAHGRTLRYDIEDIKKHPHAFVPGEEVVLTEKLHGTWCCIGWHPGCGTVVTSKGLSSAGLKFKEEAAENEKNLYVRTWRRHADAVSALRARICDSREAFYVLGEVYGKGVQDLSYGLASPGFAVFDIRVGTPSVGKYMDADDIPRALEGILPHVPFVHRGEFGERMLEEHTGGATTVDGAKHVREGVVVKPVKERRDPDIGRLVLKSVSGDYLTRKGGTEYG